VPKYRRPDQMAVRNQCGEPVEQQIGRSCRLRRKWGPRVQLQLRPTRCHQQRPGVRRTTPRRAHPDTYRATSGDRAARAAGLLATTVAVRHSPGWTRTLSGRATDPPARVGTHRSVLTQPLRATAAPHRSHRPDTCCSRPRVPAGHGSPGRRSAPPTAPGIPPPPHTPRVPGPGPPTAPARWRRPHRV
jgi:hypothetical protein